ncbi:MAG: VWA domain-containing protein [Dietzia sp.]
MTTTRTTSSVSPSDVLDIVSVAFGRLLREREVAVSPAEVVELRTVLALIGTSRPESLRAALRAVTVKYQRENRGFDAVFDRFFLGVLTTRTEDAGGAHGLAPQVGGLPDELELDTDDSSPFTPSDLDPAEIGDLVEGEESTRRNEDMHYDDSDFSTATGEEEFAVQEGAERWQSSVTYEIEVDRASSDRVGEMGSSAISVSGEESLEWADALDVLRTLDGYDARQVYAGHGDDGGELGSEQVGMFVDAVVAFLKSLPEDVSDGRVDDVVQDGRETTDSGDLERASHEVMRRIRGAPRRRSRPFARGRLDSRSTLRRAWATDGEAFTIMNRTRVPGPLKLLILVDVSLSVRPVTGFVLRLAQSLHQKVNRCSVVAFVDRPVDVTDHLLSSSGENALATVLSAPGLDLEASSDYGRMFAELLDRHGDLIDARTSVLIVGDGRSNGLDPREDLVGRISRRAHRTAWITPEARRYWNRPSCGLSAYARYLDGVVTARDPAELSERAGLLGSSLA